MQIVLLLLLTLKDTLYIFYSPECPHCKKIIEDIRKSHTYIPYKLLNLNKDSVVTFLSQIENRLDTFGDSLPVGYYKNRIFYGSLPPEFLRGKTPHTFVSSHECRKCEKQNLKITPQLDIPVFVYTPGCKHCSRFEIKLKKLFKGNAQDYKEVSTFSKEGIQIIEYLKKRGLYRGTPFLLVGDTVLYTLPDDEKVLSSILNTHLKNRRSSSLSHKITFTPTLITTIIAGLIDGINPCAFTVLLFLIAFLSYKGAERKRSVLILIFYSLGIFIAYFSVGIGLFWVLERINHIPLLNMALRILIGGIALVLGILSFYDAIVMNKEKPDSFLALSRSQKVKTHSIIKKYIDTGVIAGSFFTGLSISFVEFACTGQIYLPTLSYITKESGLTIERLGYLLLYNISFLIPLITIGLSAIFIGQKVVSRKLTGKLREIKILTGILFITLFVLIVFT